MKFVISVALFLAAACQAQHYSTQSSYGGHSGLSQGLGHSVRRVQSSGGVHHSPVRQGYGGVSHGMGHGYGMGGGYGGFGHGMGGGYGGMGGHGMMNPYMQSMEGMWDAMMQMNEGQYMMGMGAGMYDAYQQYLSNPWMMGGMYGGMGMMGGMYGGMYNPWMMGGMGGMYGGMGGMYGGMGGMYGGMWR